MLVVVVVFVHDNVHLHRHNSFDLFQNATQKGSEKTTKKKVIDFIAPISEINSRESPPYYLNIYELDAYWEL